MNNHSMNKEKKLAIRWLDGRMKDVLLLCALGLVLVLSAWQIFHTGESQESAAINATETEVRVMRLLEELDGVGEANVIVGETDGEVYSVVIVCEGANDLRVVMNIREAVAATLGTQEKAVKIYLKKE